MKLIFSVFLFLLVGVTAANAQTTQEEDFCQDFAEMSKAAVLANTNGKRYNVSVNTWQSRSKKNIVITLWGTHGSKEWLIRHEGTCVKNLIETISVHSEGEEPDIFRFSGSISAHRVELSGKGGDQSYVLAMWGAK